MFKKLVVILSIFTSTFSLAESATSKHIPVTDLDSTENITKALNEVLSEKDSDFSKFVSSFEFEYIEESFFHQVTETLTKEKEILISSGSTQGEVSSYYAIPIYYAFRSSTEISFWLFIYKTGSLESDGGTILFKVGGEFSDHLFQY